MYNRTHTVFLSACKYMGIFGILPVNWIKIGEEYSTKKCFQHDIGVNFWATKILLVHCNAYLKTGIISRRGLDESIHSI